jgi:hypothetical protein
LGETDHSDASDCSGLLLAVLELERREERIRLISQNPIDPFPPFV